MSPRTLRRILPIALVLLAASAAPARADGFLAPFLGFNYGGDSTNCTALTSCDDKRVNWGVGVGTTGGVLGFEEEFAYAPNFFGTAPGADNAVLTLMSNVLVVIPAGPVQPYGLIGVGLVRPHAQLSASSLATNQNTLGWDIGGGVNIFLAHAVGIRGDLRHVRTLQDITLGGVFANAPLDFWRASAGLTFRF
jgi:opacity protein-like surface antigen